MMAGEVGMKNCGTCKHWRRWPNTTKGFGDCLAPIPRSYPQPSPGIPGGSPMVPDEGSDCSVYVAAGTPTADEALSVAVELLRGARAPAGASGSLAFLDWHDARDALIEAKGKT